MKRQIETTEEQRIDALLGFLNILNNSGILDLTFPTGNISQEEIGLRKSVIKKLNSLVYPLQTSLKAHEKYLNEQAVKRCKENGHDFGEWEKKEWETQEEYWDAGPCGIVLVKHQEWKRKCKICGLVETTATEPEELVKARKQKERDEEIARVHKHLAELMAEKEADE